MKNRYKNIISLLLIIIFSVALISCGTNNFNEAKADVAKSADNRKEENKGFTITDSYDRDVKFDKVPKRIAVLNSDIYQLICLLGGKDKIVGIADSVKFPEPPNNAVVLGSWNDVNVEKVLELNPDVVFSYGKYTSEEAKDKLEAANIKVLFIDSYKFNQMTDEVTKVGKLLGKEDVAAEFNSLIQKYVDIINDRIGTLSEEKKVKVYFEGYSDYKSVGKGSGGQELLDTACVSNIAGSEEGDYPEISDEWIIEKNPEVIIKVVGASKEILGFGINDLSKAKETYNTLIQRTGWANLDAIKNRKVYILDNSITLSPQGSIIGALQIAKICYPDKFKDINIEKIHKEIYSKFYGIDLEGKFIYDGNS